MIVRHRSGPAPPFDRGEEFGIPGKIGVSGAGVCVHVNILHHARDGGEVGVPVRVVARHALEEGG